MSDDIQDVTPLDTSSPSTTLDAGPAATPGADPAGSSTAPAEGEKSSLLSVVRGVTEKGAAASPAATSGDPTQKQDDTTSNEGDDPDDFSNVPFNKHPRFQKLVAERNDLRPDATRYRSLQKFLSENAIDQTEAANALNIAALAKSDPAKAWELLEPIAKDLLLRVGKILPPDLRQQVQNGAITQDVAVRLAQERAKATQAEGRITHRDQVEERRRANEAQEEQAKLVRSMTDAASSWEHSKRSDPNADYDKKADALTAQVLLLQHRDGKPKTAEGVRKQLDAAWKAVEAQVAAARPRRPSMEPLIGGRPATTPRAAPKSMLEVVQQARAG